MRRHLYLAVWLNLVLAVCAPIYANERVAMSGADASTNLSIPIDFHAEKLVFSKDSRFLVTGYLSGVVRITDVVTGRIKAQLYRNTTKVIALNFYYESKANAATVDQDIGRIVVHHANGESYIWNWLANSEDRIASLSEDELGSSYSTVTYTPLGGKVFWLDESGNTFVSDRVFTQDSEFRLVGRKRLKTVGTAALIQAVNVGQRERLIVVTRDRKQLKVLDSQTGNEEAIFEFDEQNLLKNEILSIAVSPDHSQLALSTTRGIQVFHWRNQWNLSFTRSLTHENPASHLAFFRRNGKLALAAGWRSGTVRFFDLLDSRLHLTDELPDEGGSVYSMAFSTDHKWLAVSGETDGTLTVWQVRNAALMAQHRILRPLPLTLDGLNDDIVVGFRNGTTLVYDQRAKLPERISRPKLESKNSESAYAVHDLRLFNNYLVTAHRFGGIVVRDRRTGNELKRLTVGPNLLAMDAEMIGKNVMRIAGGLLDGRIFIQEIAFKSGKAEVKSIWNGDASPTTGLQVSSRAEAIKLLKFIDNAAVLLVAKQSTGVLAFDLSRPYRPMQYAEFRSEGIAINDLAITESSIWDGRHENRLLFGAGENGLIYCWIWQPPVTSSSGKNESESVEELNSYAPRWIYGLAGRGESNAHSVDVTDDLLAAGFVGPDFGGVRVWRLKQLLSSKDRRDNKVRFPKAQYELPIASALKGIRLIGRDRIAVARMSGVLSVRALSPEPKLGAEPAIDIVGSTISFTDCDSCQRDFGQSALLDEYLIGTGGRRAATPLQQSGEFTLGIDAENGRLLPNQKAVIDMTVRSRSDTLLKDVQVLPVDGGIGDGLHFFPGPPADLQIGPDGNGTLSASLIVDWSSRTNVPASRIDTGIERRNVPVTLVHSKGIVGGIDVQIPIYWPKLDKPRVEFSQSGSDNDTNVAFEVQFDQIDINDDWPIDIELQLGLPKGEDLIYVGTMPLEVSDAQRAARFLISADHFGFDIDQIAEMEATVAARTRQFDNAGSDDVVPRLDWSFSSVGLARVDNSFWIFTYLFAGLLLAAVSWQFWVWRSPTLSTYRRLPATLLEQPIENLPATSKLLRAGLLESDVLVRQAIPKGRLKAAINYSSSGPAEKLALILQRLALKIEIVPNDSTDLSIYHGKTPANTLLNLSEFVLIVAESEVEIDEIGKAIVGITESVQNPVVVIFGETEGQRIPLRRMKGELPGQVVVPLGHEISKLLLRHDPTEILTTMITSQINPRRVSIYDVGGGVKNPAAFFGRERELDAVLNGQLTNYFVIGARQVGKTSFLKELQRRSGRQDAYRTVYCPLDGADIVEPLSSVLGIAEPSEVAIRRELASPDAPIRLILLDEADDFVQAESQSGFQFLKFMRRLSDQGQAYFVLAGFWGLYRSVYFEFHSPLRNFGELILIEELDSGSAIEMITKPMQALGIEYASNDLPPLIYEQTGGRANLISHICKKLVQTVPIDSRTISEEQVYAELHSKDLNRLLYPGQQLSGAGEPVKNIIDRAILFACVDYPEFDVNLISKTLSDKGLTITKSEIEESLQRQELAFVFHLKQLQQYQFRVPLLQSLLSRGDVSGELDIIRGELDGLRELA